MKEILDSFETNNLSNSEVPIYASYYEPDSNPKEVRNNKVKEYWDRNNRGLTLEDGDKPHPYIGISHLYSYNSCY